MYGVLPNILEMFNCWERRWINVDGASHTLSACHSNNILRCTHYFWLFTLWFIDDDVSFFHFFSLDNEHTDSSKVHTQFSHTFCYITMIFKVMSQYFPALFKLYAQPYSCGGRMKLIICQIWHELYDPIENIKNFNLLFM